MQKEGLRGHFNSQSSKLNLAMLFSLVLVFVFMMFSVEAVTVRLVTPTNLTYNGSGNGSVNSRNINITFNATWDRTGDTVQNCTIWTNGTSGWQQVAVNNSQSNVSNWSGGGGANFLTSWINFTYSADANFTMSVGCTNSSDAGNYTFSTNITFFLDTLAPVLTYTSGIDSPNGGVLADATM